MRSVAVMLVWAAGCGPAPAALRDADNDGYDVSVDCDDEDPFVHPDAPEFCDGVDGDCDGVVDGPSALGQFQFTRDQDGDGYGDPDGAVFVGCDPGVGWGRPSTDCNDLDPTIHPDRDDPCNGVDDDCSGVADNNPTDRWFVDSDGDGFGNPLETRRSCLNTSPLGTDCDDADPDSYPGAPERCDGVDNDCDRFGDEFDAVIDPLTWYADLDGDGYGLTDDVLVQCVPPNALWATEPGDCNDFDPATNPGAPQRCTPVDTDCDGVAGDAQGWFDEASPYRVRLTITGTGSQGPVPAGAVVDFGAAVADLGAPGFDPDTVRIVLQDCSDGGTELPAAFVDGFGDVFAGELDATTGDEVGYVAFALDRPLGLGETLAAAVYFGGPASLPGGVSVTGSDLTFGRTTAQFDPDRGGFLDSLQADSVSLLSQADAREGNGLSWAGSWTQPGFATMTVLSSSGAFGAVRASALHTGEAGTIDWETTWIAWDGVDALFGVMTLDAQTDVRWDDPSETRLGLRPVEVIPHALVSPVAFAFPMAQPDTVGLVDGVTGVALGFWESPADRRLSCTPTHCILAGSEGQGPSGAATAGARLLDHRAVVFVPLFDGAIEPEAVDAVRFVPTVAVGSAEAR